MKKIAGYVKIKRVIEVETVPLRTLVVKRNVGRGTPDNRCYKVNASMYE